MKCFSMKNEIDKAKEYFEDEILEIASKHEASSIATIDDVCELANRWERENNLGDRFKVIENKEK